VGVAQCRVKTHKILTADQYLAESFASEGLPSSKSENKVLPYSLPSVGPGADPSVQAVSLQVTF